jgi:hypothetical protein
MSMAHYHYGVAVESGEGLTMNMKRSALFAAGVILAVALGVADPVGAGTTTTVDGETATLTVTKVVQGTAPTDAEFIIEVDCESDTTELTFGPTGGSEQLTFFSEDECTVTETQTGGAVDVTPPQTVTIAAPIAYDVTVTNVFDTPPSSPTTGAGAADAVRPTFTG